MLKRFVALILIVSLILPYLCFASEKGVVINSFRLRTTEKSTDEFVEIFNTSDITINLKGWRLVKKTATGTSYNLLASFPEIFLGPQKSLIIAHKDFGGQADVNYSVSTSSISENNSLVLYSDAGSTLVDMIGWGTAKYYENEPLPNPNPNEIWQRKNEGFDTDNNLNDFQKKPAQEKDIEEGSQVFSDLNNDTNLEIIITELMPNPVGPDTGNEWVEIYNMGSDINLRGLSISDKMGSVKKYIFGDFPIKSGEYTVFNLKTAGISLNNDGDVLEIKNSKGEIICSSGESYSVAKEGLSYAFDGSVWQWTKSPTPGATNIIEAPEEEEKKTSKKSSPKAKKKPKAKLPKASVKGKTSPDDNLFEADNASSESDKKIGIALIIIALVGGALYAIYTNWSELIEIYFKQRKRYSEFFRKLRQKIKKG